MTSSLLGRPAHSCSMLIAWITLLTPVANAAPGYTYDEIFTGTSVVQENPSHYGLMINNRSEVVFVTGESSGFNTAIYRAYISRPGPTPQSPRPAPELIYEIASDAGGTAPQISRTRPIGINDNGIVAVPLNWPILDMSGNMISSEAGFGIFDPNLPGAGLDRQIGEIRNLQGSSGRINNNLQMGGRESLGGNLWGLVITDGTTSSSTSGLFAQETVQVNDAGIVAAHGNDASDRTVVQWATPPGSLQSAVIGDARGLGLTAFGHTPGLNNLGWMTFSTESNGGGTNPNPRILLISPTGDVLTIAETATSDFVNFRQSRSATATGVPVNNFNRVSFNGQKIDPMSMFESDGIWVGDASGDPLRLAIDASDSGGRTVFSNGNEFDNIGFANDVSNHSANSMNDKGEIAVIGHGIL